MHYECSVILLLWYCYQCRISYMMASSNETNSRLTGPLWGESTGHWCIPSQRPVTRSFDIFFDLRLNKRLSKHSGHQWFETPSRSLWRHCNVDSLWWPGAFWLQSICNQSDEVDLSAGTRTHNWRYQTQFWKKNSLSFDENVFSGKNIFVF